MLRLFDLRSDERRPTALAALCYFFVLFSWYLIRPLRESLGIRDGAEDLPYLMMGTVALAAVLNPVIARVLDRRERIVAMRWLYRAVQVALIAFWIAFRSVEGDDTLWLGYAFYFVASVLNLLIVSIFWSLTNESFSREAARRCFGPAAAGGSLGAICGSFAVTQLNDFLDVDPSRETWLLIAAAVVLEGAIHSGRALLAAAPENAGTDRDLARQLTPFRGSAWAGWRDLSREPFVLLILGYMLFHSFGGTWAYFVQGEIIAAQGDHLQKFAWINLTTNGVTLLLQLFVVGRFVRGMGVGLTLSVLPILTGAGFLYLAVAPSYTALVVFQTLRRSASYGISKPTREMLFSIFTAEQKYKLKNLVDVAGYRTFDLLASVTRIGFKSLAVGTSGLCLIAAGVSGTWLVYNLNLGRAFRARAARDDAREAA